jgi:hypothetical protein
MDAAAHEFVLWLMLFAYALHILEERMLDWVAWARATFNFNLGWAGFYTTYAIVVAGICTDMIGWKLPEKVLEGSEYGADNSENALGSRVGQNELRQEARQETQGYSPTAPGGCAELASHSQEFVDDEHYRPAGKRKEKNREEF